MLFHKCACLLQGILNKFYITTVQWGSPTASLPVIIGMCAAVIASILESVGDYYACAKVAQAPPVPDHAINRGLQTFIKSLVILVSSSSSMNTKCTCW